MTDLDKDARIAELEAALGKIKSIAGSHTIQHGLSPEVRAYTYGGIYDVADRALSGDGSAGAKAIEAASSAEFVRNLPLVMDRAMRLGLYKTGHALHEAVRVSGYELAAALDKED